MDRKKVLQNFPEVTESTHGFKKGAKLKKKKNYRIFRVLPDFLKICKKCIETKDKIYIIVILKNKKPLDKNDYSIALYSLIY